MNSFLLNRQLGSISHAALARAQNTHLLQTLQAAPNTSFAFPQSQVVEGEGKRGGDAATRCAAAHAAGVNSIAIDSFEGR